jgi:hypothetical protein
MKPIYAIVALVGFWSTKMLSPHHWRRGEAVKNGRSLTIYCCNIILRQHENDMHFREWAVAEIGPENLDRIKNECWNAWQVNAHASSLKHVLSVLAALDMALAFYFRCEKNDNERWYRFDKKIMSLIYAENSDEIECALHVFIHVNRCVRYLDSCSYVCMRVYVHT